MDILDRLLGHDAWTTRQLLLVCRTLPDELLDHHFDFGQESLRRTFVHIIHNMEVWTDLISQRPVRDQPSPKEQAASVEGLLHRLDTVAPEFATVATARRDQGRFDDFFVDVLDQPPRKTTFGGGIAHLLTHSMHHRAQVLIMLDILGIQHDIEGDALGWERQLHGGWEREETRP
jgi:uncharacterized damage-inducible protein DinB